MLDLKKRGKSREAVDNLNLVPFVDLFSTLILFLMATAVFDQLASVPVNMGSNETPSTMNTSDGRATGKKITSTVLVSVNETDLVMSDSGKVTRISIEAAQKGEYSAVTEFMRTARRQHNDLREIVVNSADKAKYGDIVAVMDEALAADFDQLVVTGEED
jgi:biopolymer transport protein ExbD